MAFPIIMTDMGVQNCAAVVTGIVRGYLGRTGIVPAGELAARAGAQAALGAAGRFFFASAVFGFEVRRAG